MNKHLDVLIIGAGISGISAAVHLRKHCPSKSFEILERRDQMGGTWDLFQYPGIRSDSDMYTLGFTFKPWKEQKAIADGPSIIKYLAETIEEFGLSQKINYGRYAKRLSWSSENAVWTVEVENTKTGTKESFTCNFLAVCTGYYNYDTGYTPEYPGLENYQGTFIHPQIWPEELDYKGKNIVVIGSGATAVTIVPAMAQTAGHVTMLQRSPTYMVSRPAEDKIAQFLRKVMPEKWAYGLIRWRNVLLQMYIFNRARKQPEKVKDYLLDLLKDELPEGYDINTHFNPSYNPWDQRLCLVPDSDIFKSIKEGQASIETDTIDHFTESGIKLSSGRELQADIIVSATGLALQVLGGAELLIDGDARDPGKGITYKGMMVNDIPNMSFTFGYTNASWTLKADLTSEYICRLLNHMDETGTNQCTPRLDDPDMELEPTLDFSSGYVLRAADIMPKQGSRKPWKLNQNYALDIMALRHGKVDDGVMEFKKVTVTEGPEAMAAE